MSLSYHSGPVFSLCFSPNGSQLASCSFDQTIALWNATGPCENTQLIQASGALLQLLYTRDSSSIVCCSSDKSLSVFDIESGARTKKFKQSHIINSCSVTRRSQELYASASDDGSLKIYDPRSSKYAVKSLDTPYPALACTFNLDGSLLFSAGIDPHIKVPFLNYFNQNYHRLGIYAPINVFIL
jgi:Prp8 binding protein